MCGTRARRAPTSHSSVRNVKTSSGSPSGTDSGDGLVCARSLALMAAGNKVNLFLLNNGVYGAIRNQNNLYELSEFNINEKLSTLLD